VLLGSFICFQVNRSVFERMAKRIGCAVEVLGDGDEVEGALVRSGQLAPLPASAATSSRTEGEVSGRSCLSHPHPLHATRERVHVDKT
jgi:hypothetical protein